MPRSSSRSSDRSGDHAASRDEVKLCPTCGRWFSWRAKWARSWSEVKYCSDRCRRGVGSADLAAEQAILQLVTARGTGSACPSEVARLLASRDGREESWREQMPTVQDAARRLAARGEIVVTQRDRPVDAATARGPVRLRRR